MVTTELRTFLVTLADGRCITVEADSDYLARASAALQLGMDDLPDDAQVIEVSA